MLFWEFIFVVFILPWAWFPIVLELWNYDDEPSYWKFLRYDTGRSNNTLQGKGLR